VTQAHGGSQLQHLRLLPAGNGERLLETGVGLILLEQEFSPKPMQLCLLPVFASLLD